MDVTPRLAPRDKRRTNGERALYGLLGIAAAAGALFVTALAAFVASPDCGGPNARQVVAEKALAGAIATMVVVLTWLVAVSLFRVASGRRGLRSRSWIVAPLAVAALALPCYAVVFANEPPPSATCQPFEMS